MDQVTEYTQISVDVGSIFSRMVIYMAINSTAILNALLKEGKAPCPFCNKGFFKADVEAKRQTEYECSHCKEKISFFLKY